MAAHAKQSCSDIIYHIGSSSRNPICISNIANFLFQYFTQNPLTDKKGKLVKVAKDLFLTENMTTLHMYISIRFMLPLKIAKFGNIASCQYFPDVYTNNNRKLQQMMRLINLYKPYVLFKGIFADGNIEKLHTTVRESVKDVQLREKLWKEIDIIVDSAATTSFDARYDFALGTNTLGALHVLSLAKKCINIKMLVHISTAIKAATSKLDFKAEEKIVAEKLNELLAQGASEDEFTLLMKDFGIKRSKLHGWPNTYAFTKAMGEICLRQSKEMSPLIIVRPTMVTGSYKEPFPGWVEGLRTVDAAIASYAKGKIKCFLGNPKLIVDLVTGDVVINSIMVAMAVNANQSSEIIFHVGSSLRNPIYLSNIVNFMFQYFAKNPLIDKKGKLVKL
ncbi:fatty acyl-CoA reductase 1-like [Ziziphus jujuba]|uniref:Fatty acyl-CoA reductase n=1 Tax=Ziziphus jujuba TaxID=326968 RepID=A0ABM3ZWM3_ZIZJJ|nr:fatty acyl-CoA reductase 1-like [Ziziphus jujuba]